MRGVVCVFRLHSLIRALKRRHVHVHLVFTCTSCQQSKEQSLKIMAKLSVLTVIKQYISLSLLTCRCVEDSPLNDSFWNEILNFRDN